MSNRRGPMGHGAMHGEKAKDFKGSMKNLIKYLSAYKLSLLLVLIFAVGSTVFSIVGPKILGNATTEIFNGLVSKVSGGAGIDFAKAWPNPDFPINHVRHQCSIFLYSELFNDWRHTKSHLSITQGHFPEDQPDAYEVF